MFDWLAPDLSGESIFKLPYATLWKNGVRGLLFDIDNTLAPFDIPAPDDDTARFLSDLSQSGFSVCLISNGSKRRVNAFNAYLKFPVVYRAFKPLKRGVLKAMKIIGTTPETTALVGDQLFTDVLCGKRCGVFTALLKPASKRDEFSVRIKRGVERRFLKYFAKAGKLVDKL
ncbi:MAG: YqeG family HAD IIIA-type phosphatase [Clostridiales bacterium]|nr:YqeG family HAD IIIA-type phosphatase [Clostridiales bacterium]